MADCMSRRVLEAQTRRMLRDAKIRRLATEFACQWLHINDFEHLDEKSERHFPTFASLARGHGRGIGAVLHRLVSKRSVRC